MYRPLAQHLPALDGLRGIAALIVLAAHCANEGWLPKWLGGGMGQLGVALFYVLSGFLMLHFAIGRTFDRAALRTYAVARASRVLPLYFLAVAITTLLFFPMDGVSFYGVDEPSDLIRSWLVYRGSGVLWSVPVELHFYLLFPLLWWAHERERFLLVVAVLLAGSALLAMVEPRPQDTSFLPYWLHWFVLGSAVRWLLDDGRRNRLPAVAAGAGLQAATWICFALIALLPPQPRGVAPGTYLRDPLVLAMLPVVLGFAAAQIGPFRAFATPLLRWFGKISFSLYLLHGPVISMVKYLEIERTIGPALTLALVLSTSTFGAARSFRWFERPVQDALRKRYDRPSIAAQ